MGIDKIFHRNVMTSRFGVKGALKTKPISSIVIRRICVEYRAIFYTRDGSSISIQIMGALKVI